MKKTRNRVPTGIIILLVLVCIVQLVPFYLGSVTAFKDSRDMGSVWALPFSGGTLENFAIAWTSGHIGTAIRNSAIITVCATFIVVVVGALAAYPLARRRTRFNQGVLMFTLAVMMVPALSILVPLIRLLKDMGLMNTFPGLFLPLAAGALPQAIFLYSQALRGIPESIEEAARIDGAGPWRTFIYVVFPLLKPVTISVIILTGVGVWNEFSLATYIMNGADTRPLAPAIAAFFGNGSGANVNAAVAGSLMGVLPVLVAYLFLQRYFMKGMLAGATK